MKRTTFKNALAIISLENNGELMNVDEYFNALNAKYPHFYAKKLAQKNGDMVKAEIQLKAEIGSIGCSKVEKIELIKEQKPRRWGIKIVDKKY
jgi:hypothetical protein